MNRTFPARARPLEYSTPHAGALVLTFPTRGAKTTNWLTDAVWPARCNTSQPNQQTGSPLELLEVSVKVI